MIALNTEQHLKEDLLILSRYFYFFYLIVFFLFIYFQTLIHKKKHHVYDLYCISYILSFYYVMYYLVSEGCIGGDFLEDCFYCYSQQFISAVALIHCNESLIHYNLIKGATKTQNL